MKRVLFGNCPLLSNIMHFGFYFFLPPPPHIFWFIYRFFPLEHKKIVFLATAYFSDFNS